MNGGMTSIGGPKRPHGPMSAMLSGEKPKDFRGSVKKTLGFMGKYKWAMLIVALFAIGSTAFNVIGPKVLANATTELFNGLVARIAGVGGVDFEVIGTILLSALLIYGAAALCTFVMGWIMANVTQRLCFDFREAISKKINKVPFGHFEKTSVGDTLSRITNDVDILGQTMSQGLTQLITSVVTIIGVLVMM
ncbi:MAG: ABC transporter ATP-binding protein, partial [Eggerthellaceae bacterium]|nr:ABC transporter ATP-binding protein [Eggerthellaceae bacterium]